MCLSNDPVLQRYAGGQSRVERRLVEMVCCLSWIKMRTRFVALWCTHNRQQNPLQFQISTSITLQTPENFVHVFFYFSNLLLSFVYITDAFVGSKSQGLRRGQYYREVRLQAGWNMRTLFMIIIYSGQLCSWRIRFSFGVFNSLFANRYFRTSFAAPVTGTSRARFTMHFGAISNTSFYVVTCGRVG